MTARRPRGTRAPVLGDVSLVALAATLAAASGAVHAAGAGEVAPFVVSGVALALLAALVGRSVDRLGDRLGSGATGFVQSALGNLPELFVGIFALRAGLPRVVQSAIVGSILANVLLVLGAAFVVGGLRNGTQRFHADAPRSAALLLLLAVAVIAVPTLSSHIGGAAAHHEQALSDVASAVLLVVYVLSIPSALRAAPVAPSALRAAPSAPSAPAHSGWPTSVVVAALLGSSVTAAFVSDWFVSSLTPALGALHLSAAFAGFVVVAIAGNAVENVVGIGLAARNRPDYALSAILQSPVQIALAVLPLLVLLSGPIGGAHLNLVMPLMLLAALGIGAAIAVVVVFDGESTWLEGAALIGCYVALAAVFWWG